MLSLVPMLVMLVPMCLLLAQLALWYQARPLHAGEDAVVTVHLTDLKNRTLPEIRLAADNSVLAMIGPVRVPAKHCVCWNIRPAKPGYHHLNFEVAGVDYEKELAVGDGFMRTSLKRPGSQWSSVLLHPREEPFNADSPVRSIEIDYPEREGRVAGSRSWLLFWFVVSMVAAFAVKPLLKVHV